MPATFSILLLCWNHAPYLEQCIASLAAQGDRDFELIFLDNRSSDGSFERAEFLLAKHRLSATLLRNQENAGISANYNRLMAASTGQLLVMLSTDDWLEPDYVAAMKAMAAEYPEAGWYSCSGWRFFEQEEASVPIDERDYVTDRPTGEVILDGGEPHFVIGCVYRRAALDAVGGWDEDLPIEDRDLFLRLSQRFAHRRTFERLVHYRRSSMTASANAAFMLDGWEKYYAKHAAAFGPRLTARRAETYRSYAALLTDQGDVRGALAAIGKALRLRPLAPLSWRTLAYVGRRAIGRRSTSAGRTTAAQPRTG